MYDVCQRLCKEAEVEPDMVMVSKANDRGCSIQSRRKAITEKEIDVQADQNQTSKRRQGSGRGDVFLE